MTIHSRQIVKLLVFLLIFGTVAEGKVLRADTVTIDNSVQSSSNSGGHTSSGSAGKPGRSGTSGQSGADGANGTDGVTVEGKSTGSISVETVIDGKTVENIYKTTDGESIVSASSAVEINAATTSVETKEIGQLAENQPSNHFFLQTLESFRIILKKYVALLF